MADYNFTPSVDVTGIARLMQQKALAEQDQLNKRNQQQMDAIKFAVEQGQNLASTAVDISRRKQFANALAASRMTPGATTTIPGTPDTSAVPMPSSIGGNVVAPGTAPATIPVVPAQENEDGTVTPTASPGAPDQTITAPPTDNPASIAIRAGAKIDPGAFASRFAEQQFPDPIKLAMLRAASGGGGNYINANNGQVAFGVTDKTGGLRLSTGEYFPPGSVHPWQKQNMPGFGPNQYGVETAFGRNPGVPGTPTGTPSTAGTSPSTATSNVRQPTGLAGLRAEAPKLADAFEKIVQDANSDPAIAGASQGVSAANKMLAELAPGQVPDQIALQAMAIELAKKANGGRPAQQELPSYTQGFSLLRKVMDPGYRWAAGDISPQVRSDLQRIAQWEKNASMEEAKKKLAYYNRLGKLQVSVPRFNKYGLDQAFPSVDELTASQQEIEGGAPAAGAGGAVQLPGGFSYTVKP